MCGLFGFAGKLESSKRVALLRALCAFNSARGEDSTGLACINRVEDTIEIYREAVNPESAINDAEFLRVCDDSGQVWIGHTRFATRGAVSKENAHPFHIGDVIGAHNGIVSVTNELIARCDSMDYAVDSQYLFHLLNRDGIIGRIAGCASVVWCDMRNVADVSLIRHNNPLWIARDTLDQWIAWSSEWGHLRLALALTGIGEYGYIPFEDGKQIDVCLSHDGIVSSVEVSDNGIVSEYISTSRIPSHGCAADWEIDTTRDYNDSHTIDIDNDDSTHDDYLARLAREDELESLRARFGDSVGALNLHSADDLLCDDDYVTDDDLRALDEDNHLHQR